MKTRNLATLPKAHLHIHLNAAARPETIVELARRQDIEPPKLTSFHDFDDFIKSYFALQKILRSRADVLRVLDETVADARRDGVRYLELGINPNFHLEAFGSPEKALENLLNQGVESGERHGIEVGFNLTVNRTAGYEESIKTAQMAAKYATRGVTALGLANQEVGYPTGDFADAFRHARDAGLTTAPHAGEFVGPASIWAALRDLGATRIQHGIRAVEDKRLLETLVEAGTCLDVCPTSNVVLGVVGSIEEHPLPQLIHAGVRCSINADDPTLFGNSIVSEYELCRFELGLNDHELAKCAWDSIQCSSASEALKKVSKEDILDWLSSTA